MNSTDTTTQAELNEKFLSSSFRYIEFLEGQIRNGIEIVPFVGAGVSVPFGAPSWSKFLINVLNELKKTQSPQITSQIEVLIQENRLEEAADQLYIQDEDLFEQQIRISFHLGGEAKSHLTKSLIPSISELSNGTIITTNFDSILEEHVPEWLNINFETVIPSGNFYEGACEKLRNNKHIILKIHGDWNNKDSRVLTKSQYNREYADSDNSDEIDLNKSLPKLIHLLSASKILLFIGCSLESDRTLKTLINLHKNSYSHPHYALMSLPDSPEKAGFTEKRLREAGINVIWFQLNPSSNNPYEKLYDILKSFANLSRKPRIIRNGKQQQSPFTFHSTYLFESLKKSDTVVRHSCNRDQYIDFATRMLINSGSLNKIIWTMYQSPLEVGADLLDENLLSEADRMFQKVPAVEKVRIIIFADRAELEEYCKYREAPNNNEEKHQRILAFEDSIDNGQGKLLFASKQSLEHVQVQHLDIGYILPACNDEEILFCSNISSEIDDNRAFETIVFSLAENSQIADSPELKLNNLRRIVNSVKIGTQDSNNGGVYSNISKLVIWQTENDKH